MTLRSRLEWALCPFFILRQHYGPDRMGLDETLQTLIEPVVNGLGSRLWGIEYLTRGKSTTLKIYIDADQGINVEDCARVSRQVSSLLDVEDPIPGRYTLEVSSPGLDRRLFTKAQFEEFASARIRVSLKRPFEGRRRYTGLLGGIEGDDVILHTGEEEEYLFPLDLVDRANIIPD